MITDFFGDPESAWTTNWSKRRSCPQVCCNLWWFLLIFLDFRSPKGCLKIQFQVSSKTFVFWTILASLLIVVWLLRPWDYIVKYASKCMFACFDFRWKSSQEMLKESSNFNNIWEKKNNKRCDRHENPCKSNNASNFFHRNGFLERFCDQFLIYLRVFCLQG